MENTMTIKQIAELTGKSRDAVTKWIQKISNQNNNYSDQNNFYFDSIKEKISKASSKYPAQFTLEETIAIIRAGGNDTLANLLMDNVCSSKALSTQVKSADAEIVEIKKMVLALAQAVKNNTELIETAIIINNKGGHLLDAPAVKRTHITIRQYFNEYYNNGSVKLSEVDEKNLAVLCCNMCYLYNIKVANPKKEDLTKVGFPREQVFKTFKKHVTVSRNCLEVEI